MIHNAWAEMGANAKLFYDAFRGLCRMRIAYAQKQIDFLAWETEPDQMFPLSLADAEKIEKFWTKVKEYWEGKLKLSYQWEKDYFGSEKPLEIIPAEKLDVTVSI